MAAAVAMNGRVSSASAQPRLTIPVRVRIHSSVESICSQISSLVTIRRGR